MNNSGITLLSKWKIGNFHLTRNAALASCLCIGWCTISLSIVIFRDWKKSSTKTDNVDIDSDASFSYKNLSDWEKFGVAIIFFADFFMATAIWIDAFIIFFFLFWMITFRIGHQHISGRNGYKVVGTMLWSFLVVLWAAFATNF
ncbi:hypothetical protein [Levilactobacillus yiduensis]|uniref:hypothetical protein n=1 Tax=Levilactobacillus yiduensis TaxID=2953880 RepID=UPI000EF34F4E|nr:hypothetical protein [Levilactobacillus yiduensis]AYM01829.1 hypothetical protein D8911_02045 [Levilactobacillus brevis]